MFILDLHFAIKAAANYNYKLHIHVQSMQLVSTVITNQWRHYADVGAGARKKFGPHKVMTCGGPGGFSARKLF